MTSPRSSDAALATLSDGLLGRLVRPGDGEYASIRRGWNGRFDRRPDLIARCRGAADVMAAVDFAREHGLAFGVRSGGHDYAGLSTPEGGLLVDLGAMDAVRVDPRRRRATVQPGARWGAVDHETQAFGLATVGGTVSTVGVAGFTLGGGMGYLTRKHGLALDNVLGLDVVTASGELVRASDEENPDLFWALRGGSGNVGVVTAFDFRLHEVGPRVTAVQAFHRIEAAGDVVRFWRGFMADAPDEVEVFAMVVRVPPAPGFPEELHGRPCVALVGCHVGGLEEGRDVLTPCAEHGDPFLAVLDAMPYTAVQQAFDAGVGAGLRWYTKAHDLDGLPDAAVDAFVAHAADLHGPFGMAYLTALGGAATRVPADATAFAGRDAAYSLHIFPGWEDPAEDDAMIAWARDFHAAMRPWSTGGAYVNLLAGDEDDPAGAAWGKNLPRLREVKAAWDPDNLFRSNHNVAPAG